MEQEKKNIDESETHSEGQDSPADVEILDAEVEQDEQENESEDVTSSEVEQVQAELKETQNRSLRLQAEYDNFKKRTQREREADRKFKAQDIVEDILPILDNFERALAVDVDEAAEGFKDGVDMVYRQLTEALKTHGVEEIKAVGETFDPHLHHAVMQENDDQYPENTVIEELQKGYSLKERVIRAAMVKVNQG